MPQRFRWRIFEVGSDKYDLLKETKMEAVSLTAREISDYLYQYANLEDAVTLTDTDGTVIAWPDVRTYLAEDVKAQEYGLPASNVDVDDALLDEATQDWLKISERMGRT